MLRLLALLGTALLGSMILPAPGTADVYVYQDRQGVLTFTNVPNHGGYRRLGGEPRGSRPRIDGSTARAYEDLIQSASDRHSIDADLIRAVIKTESAFNSTARSHKGAMGLMQLMPDTARLHNVFNAYDPTDNIEGGVRHLKLLLGRFDGNLELTLAAYNAGIKAVERFGGIPPFAETKEYVRRVLQSYDAYRSGVQLSRSTPH